MNTEGIKEEVIVLDDDDDSKPNEYFTFDSKYKHFFGTTLDTSSPIVLSDDEVKSLRRPKKRQSKKSTYEYKCGLCRFGSKHRFVIMNHYQMNHVTETPPVEPVILIDDIPDEPGSAWNTPTVRKVPTINPVRKRVHIAPIRAPILIEPYKRPLVGCDKCGYSTYNVTNLKIHAKIHSQIFPYKCNLCDFAAHNSFTVFNHYQLNHIDTLSYTLDSLFECHVCGYMTDDREVYNLHAFNCYKRKFCSVRNESTTNGESFYCSICGFKSTHGFILTNHIRMAHEFKDDRVKIEDDTYDLNTKYIIKDEFIVAES